MLLEKHNNNLYPFKGCEAPSFELVRSMISFRNASKTFPCSVFPVVWLHQLSIVHDCAGERRNSFPFGIRVISKLLCTIRDRHTVFMEAAARLRFLESIAKSGFVYLRSFVSSPSHWPFTSCFSFADTHFRRIRKKTFSHLSSPWSNHPIYLFLRLMIKFRLARVVTYILTVLCRPVSISIPIGLGRRVVGAEITLITDYCQKIFLLGARHNL